MADHDLMERLQLKVPLIMAPMAGGPSSIELVIASSESGALGSVGAAYLPALEIEEFVNAVRSKTKRPVAINLFIPSSEPKISKDEIEQAVNATEIYRKELGLAQPTLSPPYEEDFDKQFESVLRLRPEAFSFVFGVLGADYIKAAKKEKIFLIGTATTLLEALALQDSGIEAITLQGIEAGGHRGIFDAKAEDPEIAILDLLDLCSPKIKVPMIAAGGIMTSSNIKAALSKGAQAVQMGTAFLNCKEAGTSAAYRRALSVSSHRKTKTTRVFSGRLARGIENRFMLEMEEESKFILPFPAQNKLTRELRAASAKNDSSEFLSLWSGAGDGVLWTGSAGDLISKLFSNMISEPKSNTTMKDFLKVFIVPVLINKMFMMYFGLNYSSNPGEGYGYGLAATIAFLALTCGLFIWKYRNVEDP